MSLEKCSLGIKQAELVKLIEAANIIKTEAEMREAERNYKMIDIALEAPIQISNIENPEEEHKSAEIKVNEKVQII